MLINQIQILNIRLIDYIRDEFIYYLYCPPMRIRKYKLSGFFRESKKSDLLLLDEPTNNLDHQGIDRLTEFIINSERACMVISHDEDFLNSFSDSVLYLDSFTHKIEQYEGNYLDVKTEITKRIARENAENSRKAKMAQEKKDQAGKFMNKGGNLRAVARRMREVASALEEDMVRGRALRAGRDDDTIPPDDVFVIIT